MNTELFSEKFFKNMGTGIIFCSFLTGRVNLIGEHTDITADMSSHAH